MAQATEALAPKSRHCGVFLHGLAGAGKTTCALELAYGHADAFARVVWWQAPPDDSDSEALASLGTALEQQLAGFSFRTVLGDPASYPRQLRDLTALLEGLPVLLVLDGLDTLLEGNGRWLDQRWDDLIRTLEDQQGLSRVILTSRLPFIISKTILSLPVHNLPLDETIQLAGELPHLGELLHPELHGRSGQSEDDRGMTRDRELVRRVLAVVQGSPRLLELADTAAANLEQLERQLSELGTGTFRQERDAFFRYGVSAFDAKKFQMALSSWTLAAVSILPPAAQLMAQVIACLEEEDRHSFVIDANWPHLWRRLRRAGEPPAPEPLLAALVTDTLTEVKGTAGPSPGEPPNSVAYRMHPGVAAPIAEWAGPEVRESVYRELAAFWATVAYREIESEQREDSSMSGPGRAGGSALPDPPRGLGHRGRPA